MGGAALRRGHYPPLEIDLEGEAGSRREPEVVRACEVSRRWA